jgi:hypothetical protein
MLSTQPPNRNGFPAELDDREWLASRCQPLGDETIAAELGVSRKTIRRAYARFGIPQPKPSNGNGSANKPTTSSNGSGKESKTSSNGSSKRTTAGTTGPRKPTNGKPTGRPLASDQELVKRVGHVKTGLEVVVATLVRLANEMEWVGHQVQPQTTPKTPASGQRSNS